LAAATVIAYIAGPMNEDRLFAPACARNRDPILDVLRPVLPARGLVLEAASGSGEHVIHLAAHFPNLTFQPSDPDARARRSIAAWIASSGAANILAPLALDAASPHWPVERADAVLCINMIHISPWASTLGLFAGAARILPSGAPLYLYGPYKRGGAHTSASNADFDASLRAQNPEFGVRNLEDVAKCAAEVGFLAPEVIEMPANNLSLVFRRARATA
jgi:hypothetical protein